MRNAYYTVEATFVMTISLWVIFAIFYGGFFIHDRMIVSSVTNEVAIKETDSAKIKTSLEKKLFLMQVQKVSMKKGLASVDVTVSYRLPIHAKDIRHLFQKEEGDSSYTISREIVKYAKYKWDYDILKGKGK